MMDDAATHPANAPNPETDARNEGLPALARKGSILLALLVAAAALFVALSAVSDAIRIWLEPRWVPIWRALFALGVACLALWMVRRLS